MDKELLFKLQDEGTTEDGGETTPPEETPEVETEEPAEGPAEEGTDDGMGV